MILTGELVDADEALRIGLVNRVVPAERLLDEADALANRLAQGPEKHWPRPRRRPTAASPPTSVTSWRRRWRRSWRASPPPTSRKACARWPPRFGAAAGASE